MMFSTKVMTVITLLSVLFLFGVVMLQGLEFNYYAADPSLWP